MQARPALSPVRRRDVLAAVALLVALTGGGCKKKGGRDSRDPADGSAQGALDGKGKKKGPAVPPNPNMQTLTVDSTRCNPEGKRTTQSDLNHDKRADIITLYTSDAGGDTISCKQVDFDHDGNLDGFFHYDEGGEVVREQYDLDFDGRIDTGRYFEGGELAKQEQDLDRDGYVDAWRFYDKGRLTRIETDRDGDGKPDMYQHFVAEQIDRIGYDVDGDGVVDQWDHDAARRARLALERRKPDPAPGQPAPTEYVEEPPKEGEEGKDGKKDAGKDGKKDAGKDAKKDAGKDAKKDAAKDANKDAGKDAKADSGTDAKKDAG